MKKGLCVIVNVHEKRDGSEVDVTNCVRVFKNMGYDVKVENGDYEVIFNVYS